MSLKHDYDHLHHDESSIDDTTTQIASSSSSSKTKVQSPTRGSPPFLDSPRNPLTPLTRDSLDSTLSGSDLARHSFSTDPFHDHGAPLLRSLSTDSGQTTLKGRLCRSLSNFWIANYGALLVMTSQLFGVLMNLCTTLLEHSTSSSSHGGMHPFQILFVRQSITATLCITWALYTKAIPHFPFGPKDLKIRLLLVTRGFTGFFGVFGMYYSLLYLPLADATVLTFLTPILTCYLCSYVLPGQSSGFSRQQQIAAFVSLVGVVFIAQPAALFKSSSSSGSSGDTNGPANPPLSDGTGNFDAPPMPSDTHHPTPSQHLSAILCGLLGVLGSTAALTSIRAIGTRVHPFLSINYFSVWCSIVSLACLMIFPTVNFRLPADAREWGFLTALGVCGFTMQWLLTSGLAYGSTSNDKNQADLDHPHGLEHVSSAAEVRFRAKREQREQRMKGSGTRATSMIYTQMLFALLGDRIFLGVSPTWNSWVGSALILTGAIWVAIATENAPKAAKESAIELGAASGVGSFSSRFFGRGNGPSEAQGQVREESVGLMSRVEEEDHDDEGLYQSQEGRIKQPGQTELAEDLQGNVDIQR